MKAFTFEDVEDVLVGTDELEFCSTWNANCSNVVGVIVVQYEDVTVATRGRNKERAGLVSGDVTGCREASSKDMMSFGWVRLGGIVYEVRGGVVMFG